MTTDVAVPFKVMDGENRRVVSLEQISDFITKGTTPTTYGFEWVHEGVPFLRSECVSEDGFTTSGLCYVSEEAHQSFSRSVVHGDDLLITITGNVGRVAKYPTTLPEGNINQHIARVRIADVDSADSDYVLYTLKSRDYRRYFESIVTGLAYPQLSLKQIRNTPVSLPPLPEQKKIAEVLSSVDEAIAATKAVIDQTKQVKKGLLQTLLTKGIGHTKFKQTELGEIPRSWEVVCLEEIALVERGKFSARPRNDPKYYGGDIPFIQTGDVVSSNGILRKHRQTLNEHGLGVSKRFAAHVVLVTIAANIGDTAITTYPVCCPDSIVAVQPNEGIDVFWLQHVLASKKNYLDSVATQNAQKNINLTYLKPLLVALPPFEERENIASILNELRNTEVDNFETLEQLQTLKSGLMSDLITGRKRVEV